MRDTSSPSSVAVPVNLKSCRSHAEQIADRCIHFNGIQHDACDAGVRYDDVKVEHEPVPYRYGDRPTIQHQTASRPCHKSGNLGGATCAKCEFPTPEAVAAQVEESNRGFERVMKARRAIVDHIAAGGSRGGFIDCPNCGAKLGYSQAASNGHIHARCATEGCASWME